MTRMRSSDAEIRRGHEATKNVVSMLARNFGGMQFDGLLKKLKKLRLEGNKEFRRENWGDALRAYSQGICLAAGGDLDVDASNKEEFDCLVMLTYSNRAEARLRLRQFEYALQDAEEALKIKPDHLKTLIRKGRAAHELALYEKACEAFNLAFEQSPPAQEQSTRKRLRSSTIAYQQSRTGEYDLAHFFSLGEIPSCTDFVGPVEIRRAGHGGWGLFATKSLEPGELLLVSNPLAVIRWKFLTDFSRGDPEEVVVDLSRDLCYQVDKSRRQMAKLYSLRSNGNFEMGFPSMELFRPGSDWIPPGAEDLELDMPLVYDITRRNRFEYTELKGSIDCGDVEGVTGLWILPTFAKHSCAPNCQHSFVGDALFFRAAGHITSGEELTVPYFDDLLKDSLSRQATCESWMFTCKCERCHFEEGLRPQLLNISRQYHKLKDVAVAESFQEMGKKQKRSMLKDFAKATDEVEAVIQSLGFALLPKQQGWIRAAFSPFYLSKFLLEVTGPCAQPSSRSLRLIFDMLTSVYLMPKALTWAAMLLSDVADISKDSQAYREPVNCVLSICRVMFGNQPDAVLWDLVMDRVPTAYR